MLVVVPTKDVKIGCFAYGSTVRTEAKGVISIEDVRTGDRVESMSPDGKVIFSDVIMIMHQVMSRHVRNVKQLPQFTAKYRRKKNFQQATACSCV